MKPRGRLWPRELTCEAHGLLLALLVGCAAISPVLIACFNPRYGTCPFACASSKTCPQGYSCIEGKCCNSAGQSYDVIPFADTGSSCSGTEQAIWKATSAWEGTKTRLKVDGTALVVEATSGSTADLSPKSATAKENGAVRWTRPACSCAEPFCSLWDSTGCTNYKGVYADMPASGVSDELSLQGFGVDIPAEAEVLGITASLRRWQSATSTSIDAIMDKTVQLLVDGKPTGANKSSGARWRNPAGTPDCDQAEALATYGGETDLWEISPPLSGAQAVKLGLLLQIQNRYSTAATGYLCSARLSLSYTVNAGEFTTPQISIDEGGCWTKLEAKTTTTGCATGAVLFDLLGPDDNVLNELAGKTAEELSEALAATVTATQLKVRVRLRASGSECQPRLETLEIWGRAAPGGAISSSSLRVKD